MDLEFLFKILDNVSHDCIRSDFKDYLLFEKKYDLEKLREFGPLNEDEALYFFVIAFMRFHSNILNDAEMYDNE